MTPATVYAGRTKQIATERERIKRLTMESRRLQHRQTAGQAVGLIGEPSCYLLRDVTKYLTTYNMPSVPNGLVLVKCRFQL